MSDQSTPKSMPDTKASNSDVKNTSDKPMPDTTTPRSTTPTPDPALTGVDYSNRQEPTLPHVPSPPPPIFAKDPTNPPKGPSPLPSEDRHPVFTANKETHFEKASVTGVDVKTYRSGDAILLTGTNFLGVESVSFNGVHSANFTVLSDTEIVATVPHGETRGVIAVLKNVPDAEKSKPELEGEPAVVVFVPLVSEPFEVK